MFLNLSQETRRKAPWRRTTWVFSSVRRLYAEVSRTDRGIQLSIITVSYKSYFSSTYGFPKKCSVARASQSVSQKDCTLVQLLFRSSAQWGRSQTVIVFVNTCFSKCLCSWKFIWRRGMVSHVVSQSNEVSLPTALNDANTNESRTIKVIHLFILTRLYLGYVQLFWRGVVPLNEEDLGRCFQPKP